MNKALKITLWTVGGLLGLLVVGITLIALTFNPNDYKPLIVKLVKEKKQRTLNIEGDIKLAFWPKLGADLGKVALSERNSAQEFASMQGAKVFVSVLPLLRKELVIDTVVVDGVQAHIVRHPDGSTNFDDLLSQEEDSEELKFNIDGVRITNAAVTLDDQLGKRQIAVNQANISTGHIAKNQPISLDAQLHLHVDNPAVNSQIAFKGTLLADAEHQQYGAEGIKLTLTGDIAPASHIDLQLSGDKLDAKPHSMEFLLDGLKLNASAKLSGNLYTVALDAPRLTAQRDEVSGKQAELKLTQTQGKDALSAKLIIADLKGSPKAFQSSAIRGEISGQQGARALNGSFSSPFSGNLESLVFDLPKLVGNVDIKDPALPKGALKTSFNLNAHADVKQEQARLGLDAVIDGASLKGNVAVAGFAQPHLQFDLSSGVLDLNQLLGSKQDSKAQPAAPAKPAELSALKNLTADGKLAVAGIIYEKTRISNLALTLKADGQSLMMKPLSLQLDDSTIKGSVGIRHFDHPQGAFDLDIDRIDADRYAPPAANTAQPAPARPLNLSALKALNAEGSLRIGNLKFGKVQSSNIRIELKADGQKLSLDPFLARVDDSQIRASLGISRFERPIFSFNLDVDKLDADRYIAKSAQPTANSSADTPIDLSALKFLNANGEARLGWLKVSNLKTTHVKLALKAEEGRLALAPFSANLYQGAMNGALHVDARAVPAIAFKQEMKGIQIGPLLADAIHNDMLDGKGALNVDLKTQGGSVNALKKALNGNAALLLTEGAVKGIDIAGTVRDLKNQLKFNGNNVGADQRKKTDFSELSASFKITNGVAHNDDLSMKSPLLRVTGSGDIDIGSETLNYTARPTVVSSLKGQGGADLNALNGLTFPVIVTGAFAAPKFTIDFAAVGAEIARKTLLGKVGGQKGDALQKALSGDTAGALQGLVGGKAQGSSASPTPQQNAAPESKTKQKLNKLLGL